MAGLAQRLLAQLGEARVEQGMAGGQQAQLVARRDLRQVGVGELGEAQRGLQQVELAEEIGMEMEGGQGGARLAHQLGQNAPALRLFLVDRLLQGVVGLDDVERLEVEALAGGRAAVHQAGAAAAGAGLEHHHQTAAAQRDGVLRQLVLVAGDEIAEVAVDVVAHPADLAPQGGEAGAGVLAHLAAAVERALDAALQGGEVGQGGGPARQARAGRIGLGHPLARRAAGAQQVGQADQVDALERRPAGLQAEQQLAHRDLEVGHQRAAPRSATQTGGLLVEAPPLAELGERGRRREGEHAVPSEVARREEGDHRQQARQLQRLGGRRRQDEVGVGGGVGEALHRRM